VRPRTLNGLKDAASLKQVIQADTPQSSLGQLLEHLREQVAGEEDDKGTEERG
jgi:hypothetical protein